MSFSELLKQCRKKQGISQAELASKLGVTQQAVGKWESGKSSPDPSTVARIAELLNTTADYLLGLYRPVSNVSAPEERFFGSYSESLIPVIGTVKAGYGALAFEEDYGQEYARVKDPSNYFYLVVRGDSMEPRIQDGDLALVHKQDTLENGDLGVLIYGDEGEGKTLACTNTAPEQQPHILFPHFRPVGHIPLCQLHLWILPMIVCKCPVLHRPVGKALQLQPLHFLVMQPCTFFFLLLFPCSLPAPAFSRMAVTPKQFFAIRKERFLGSFAAAAVQQPIFCNIVLRFHRDRHKPVHRCLDRFRHKLSSLL